MAGRLTGGGVVNIEHRRRAGFVHNREHGPSGGLLTQFLTQ